MQFLRAIWQTIKDVRNALSNFSADDGFRLAAAVSYYAALSMFPLLLILTAATGFFLRWTGWGKDAEGAILTAVGEQASPDLADRVGEILEQIQAEATVGGPVGLVALIVAAGLIFAQFEQAFDRIWNVEQDTAGGILQSVKNVLWYRLKAFAMLFCMGAIIVAAFITDLVVSSIARRAPDVVFLGTTTWTVIQVSVAVGLNWLAVTVLFRVLPKAPVRWIEAARGALLVALAWELGRRVIAAFVIADRYSTYGVIGSFIALLLWVYYGTAIIFVGAEYVQVVCRRCHPDASNDESANSAHNARSDPDEPARTRGAAKA